MNWVTSFRVDRSQAVGYYKIKERKTMDTTQLKRIADALEEILRLVRQDQEAAAAYKRQQQNES